MYYSVYTTVCVLLYVYYCVCVTVQAWYLKTPLGKRRTLMLAGGEDDKKGKKGGKDKKGKKGKKGKKK